MAQGSAASATAMQGAWERNTVQHEGHGPSSVCVCVCVCIVDRHSSRVIVLYCTSNSFTLHCRKVPHCFYSSCC